MKNGAVNLYVFGSCLRTDTPNDIDFLWVYDNEKYNTRNALEFVNQKVPQLKFSTSIYIHNTVLSKTEEESVHFIKATQAQLLGSWTIHGGDSENEIISRINELRADRSLMAIF